MFLTRFEPRNVGKAVVITAVVVILAFVVIVVFTNVQPLNNHKAEMTELEKSLIASAKQIFNEKKATGINMKAGPCLSNELDTGWVLDVAHNPRDPIDNLPENQCQAFIKGQAEHFVELDLNGELIKIK